MKRLIEYLFKPIACEYESNWSTQCYNRMWYIIATVINPIALAISTFISLLLNDVLLFVVVTFTIFLFIDVFQLMLSEKIYKEHCDYLRSIK